MAVAYAFAIVGVVSSSALSRLEAAPDGRGGAEREALQKSWADTCEHYDSQTQGSALEACNLQWFRDHEKDVWRLDLNPHGAVVPIPPPS